MNAHEWMDNPKHNNAIPSLWADRAHIPGIWFTVQTDLFLQIVYLAGYSAATLIHVTSAIDT